MLEAQPWRWRHSLAPLIMLRKAVWQHHDRYHWEASTGSAITTRCRWLHRGLHCRSVLTKQGCITSLLQFAQRLLTQIRTTAVPSKTSTMANVWPPLTGGMAWHCQPSRGFA